MTDFNDDIAQCISVLQAGGVILYPTDTIWGLGCDVTNPLAVQKIFDIKQRNESKALIVLAISPAQVRQYTTVADDSVFDYLKTTTKPTTIIYDQGRNLAPNLLAADGSVGIRICANAFCRDLIQLFGKPIVSTSANISDMPSPSGFAQISTVITQSVDYVVQYGQQDTAPQQASAIVKWNEGNRIIIRA